MSGFWEERPMTSAERQSFRDSLPEAARGLEKFENPRELTTATLCYGIDIGFYVAEVFMREYPHVHWVLWKNRGHAFNKPVLAGFKLPLIPSDLVTGSIWKSFKDSNGTVLLDAFKVWEKDLSDS